MVAINRLIAQMESKEKKNDVAGPSRESRTRKRKKVKTPSPSPSSSSSSTSIVGSNSDTDDVTSTTRNKVPKTQSSVPGPSSSHASTSAPGPSSSFSNQVPSNVDLLDLRTEDKKIVPSRNNRERRWESDDSEHENDDASFVQNLITPTHCSDSSDSTSSGLVGNQEVVAYGARGGRSRPRRTAAPSFFGPRDNDEDSSEDEPLFAPETDSDVTSNPYEADSGGRSRPRRSGGFFSLSPPRPVQDLLQTRGPHALLEGSSSDSERRSSLSYPFVVPTSSEDENGLLDLRTGTGNLTDNENDQATSGSSSSGGGREGEGYWSEAHDWMTGSG